MLQRGLRLPGLLASRRLHYGAGDSAQARRAAELFLAKASPAAAGELGELLQGHDRPTLDALLLDALRGENTLVPDGSFRHEWVAFAASAQKQHRSSEAARAWAQHDAFGDEDREGRRLGHGMSTCHFKNSDFPEAA